MSASGARRSAARQAAIRRRRATAGAIALALLVVLVAVLSGAGGAHKRAQHPARAGGERAAAALTRVRVAQAGRLPAPVQDAAGTLDGTGAVLLLGGLDAREESLASVVRVSASGVSASRVGSLASALHDASAARV